MECLIPQGQPDESGRTRDPSVLEHHTEPYGLGAFRTRIAGRLKELRRFGKQVLGRAGRPELTLNRLQVGAFDTRTRCREPGQRQGEHPAQEQPLFQERHGTLRRVRPSRLGVLTYNCHLSPETFAVKRIPGVGNPGGGGDRWKRLGRLEKGTLKAGSTAHLGKTRLESWK